MDFHQRLQGPLLSPEQADLVIKENFAKNNEAKHTVVYVHIPFCNLRCTYCGFHKNIPEAGVIQRYVAALQKEIETLALTPYVQTSKIEAVFFGGGTPSLLDAMDLENILGKIKKNLHLLPDCEITLESTVGDMDADKLQKCVSAGFNRFSFGVQTFDTILRRSLGRKDAKEVLLQKLKTFLEIEPKIIIDLIYGLPGQNIDLVKEDLRLAAELHLGGLDLYSLKLLRNTPLGKQAAQSAKNILPSQEEREKMFAAGVAIMNQYNWHRLNDCHWASYDGEKSVYNNLVKKGSSNIAFGAACGGHIGAYHYFKDIDLPVYFDKVQNGKMPLFKVIKGNENYIMG